MEVAVRRNEGILDAILGMIKSCTTKDGVVHPLQQWHSTLLHNSLESLHRNEQIINATLEQVESRRLVNLAALDVLAEVTETARAEAEAVLKTAQKERERATKEMERLNRKCCETDKALQRLDEGLRELAESSKMLSIREETVSSREKLVARQLASITRNYAGLDSRSTSLQSTLDSPSLNNPSQDRLSDDASGCEDQDGSTKDSNSSTSRPVAQIGTENKAKRVRDDTESTASPMFERNRVRGEQSRYVIKLNIHKRLKQNTENSTIVPSVYRIDVSLDHGRPFDIGSSLTSPASAA